MAVALVAFFGAYAVLSCRLLHRIELVRPFDLRLDFALCLYGFELFSVITSINAHIWIGPLDFERFQLLSHIRCFIKSRSRERLPATLDPDVPWGLHFK